MRCTQVSVYVLRKNLKDLKTDIRNEDCILEASFVCVLNVSKFGVLLTKWISVFSLNFSLDGALNACFV